MGGISTNELFPVRRVFEKVLVRKVFEKVLVRRVFENPMRNVFKNNLLLYIIKMTCSICYEMHHNANECTSAIINNTSSMVSDIFIKDIRSYADLVFIEHSPSHSNIPITLRSKLKSLCKTITKSLWHRTSERIIDSIELNLPFFSSFKENSLSPCMTSMFHEFKCANKFTRRASYKHFFLKLLKLLCRFYSNMDPQIYLNRISDVAIQAPVRGRYPARYLLTHRNNTHRSSLRTPIRYTYHNFPSSTHTTYRNNLFTPLRSSHLFPSTPLNIIHRPTYSEDSLDNSIYDSFRELDPDESNLNLALSESIRTLESEESARAEFTRTELKSRIQFFMHPLTSSFKNNSCSVCLEDMTPQHSVGLNCLHAFCTSCLDGVINQSKGVCPMCRDPITTVLFKPDIHPDSFNSLAHAIYT